MLQDDKVQHVLKLDPTPARLAASCRAGRAEPLQPQQLLWWQKSPTLLCLFGGQVCCKAWRQRGPFFPFCLLSFPASKSSLLIPPLPPAQRPPCSAGCPRSAQLAPGRAGVGSVPETMTVAMAPVAFIYFIEIETGIIQSVIWTHEWVMSATLWLLLNAHFRRLPCYHKCTKGQSI